MNSIPMHFRHFQNVTPDKTLPRNFISRPIRIHQRLEVISKPHLRPDGCVADLH